MKTTDDDFLGGALRIRQPEIGFRAGIDSVLVQAAVPARAGDLVVEAGSGAGIAGFCLLKRLEGVRLIGLEIQPALVALAKQNAETCGLEDRAQFVEGDVAGRASVLKEAGIAPAMADHVFANPPFFAEDAASLSPEPSKALANAAPAGAPEAWVRFLCRTVKPGGTVTVVHRVEALPALFRAFQGRAGGLFVFPLWPKAGEPAKRAIVQARRESRAPLALGPGLVLHEEDGRFTDAAEAVLRHGSALPIAVD